MREIDNKIGEEVFSFFADTMPSYGYTDRDGQMDMACEIIDSIKQKKPAMIEAGVGIGKSFAYLVPAVLLAHYYNKDVVIATSTNLLQDQLEGDAKKVMSMLHIELPVYVIKGQNNYICYEKLDEYTLEYPHDFSKQNISKIKKLSERKDIELLDGFTEKFWQEVNIDRNAASCSYDACKYFKNCVYKKYRKEIKKPETKVIICNQDMLIAHQITRLNDKTGIFNNDLAAVFIDEAHGMEDKIRDAYTKTFQPEALSRCAKQLQEIISKYLLISDKNAMRIISCAEHMKKDFEQQMHDMSFDNDEATRYYVELPSEFHQVRKMLADLYTMAVATRKTTPYLDNLYDNLDLAMKTMTSKNYIYWMERNEYGKPVVHFCPKNISGIGKRLLFTSKYPAIFTSATLTSNDGFSGYKYFGNSIGFPMKGLLFEQKPSPFDYDKHTVMYIPNGMPHPTERGAYLKKGVDEINKLVKISHGRTMILFTSKTDMMYIKNHLNTIYHVYVQNGKNTDAIENFKKDENSILLGTNLWEGVNIAGSTLSQVIVFKLPFSVPDPVIDYKTSLTKNPMYDVLFPEMIIRLKQGCGRLIRNEQDRGIISILDSRISVDSGTYYGEEVRKALPYKNIVSDKNEIEKWL